jgi:hypothetical protein
MPTLKYDGKLPSAEVVGYGHFVPGEEKTVDIKTANDFDCAPCKEEGWTVTFDTGKKSKSADTENTTEPARDASPRGPRQSSRTEND